MNKSFDEFGFLKPVNPSPVPDQRPFHEHRPMMHGIDQAYDDLGAFPVKGMKGDKGDKGDTGVVLGGYRVNFKSELANVSDLDQITDQKNGDLYFIREDGFYRMWEGGDSGNWIMVLISTLPGKDGKNGTGVPEGGKPGDVLMKTADGTEWVAYRNLWKVAGELESTENDSE